MKKTALFILTVLIILFVAGCDPHETDKAQTKGPSVTVTAATTTRTSVQTATRPKSFEEILADAKAVEEVNELLMAHIRDKNYEAASSCIDRMIQIDPANREAYYLGAEIRMLMLQSGFDEMNKMLLKGVENLKDPADYLNWISTLMENSDFTLDIPFLSDFSSPDEINRYGITSGNQTNAGKYDKQWRGGLVTWQGSVVYISRPDEDYAIYKMNPDGSRLRRVGDACGSSLNVIGDWIYFINTRDEDKIYKMRTDGSMPEKVIDVTCAFLSVSDEYMFYDNGSKDGTLSRTKLGSSEIEMIADDVAMFTCAADGSIYYCPKSNNGGLNRISEKGKDVQRIVNGPVRNYCVLGEWIYYIYSFNNDGVRRVRVDGTGDELFVGLDSYITSINVSDDTLYICFDKVYEEDGFEICDMLVAIDINTHEKKFSFNIKTEPVCTGPDGWFYFFDYSEGMKWYASDESGIVTAIVQ